jgi:alpha-D-ribose 1-methylphosphonate 5-triphosphate synthase subunit PhnH
MGSYTQLHPGRQWVRAANTPISLSTNPAGNVVVPMGCCEVVVQADLLNGGVVAVGGPGITTVPAVGPQLLPGQSRSIHIDDVSKVFVVGATIGLAVSWEAIA